MSLLNKMLLGIGAALVLLIVVAFVWLALANAHLKTQLAQAQANNTACHLANDEFSAQILAQNQAVEALQAQGAARAAKARLAEIAAQKTIRVYRLAADRLRKATARGDQCQAANALFTGYIKGAK